MSSSEDSDMCVCSVCNGVRDRLNKMFKVLDSFGWILDTYIVDFFEDDIWNKLPNKWRQILQVTSPEELGEWVLGKSSSKNVWPLSLLALRKTIETLGINRDFTINENVKCQGSEEKELKNIDKGAENLKSGKKRKLIGQKYEKLFTKSVKRKKQHEIEKISEITIDCATRAKCECIVDIGAGMGHLARSLAYNYGLYIVCLEQNETLSQRAKKCDENLFSMLQQNIPEILQRNPHHISTRVVESDIEGQKLATRLKNEFIDKYNLNETKAGFGLIGLHPCGDLAGTLLKFYSQQEEARFICIVGCCYMKITSGDEKHSSFGYPLSKHVSIMNNHALSYAALEVSCHAIENYCDKLKTGDYDDLLVHAYRATLETILIRKNGKEMRRSHLKNVKLKKDMTFERYCAAAVECLKPEQQPDRTDFTTENVSNCLQLWRHVVAFGTLRFMLAPLVETIVLLDRFLYLSEKNLMPSIKAIFDPRISPRNIVLTSCK